MLMNDLDISLEVNMIFPVIYGQVKQRGGRGLMSYGHSSYGYDARLSPDGLRVFQPSGPNNIVDPKHPNPAHYVEQSPGADGAYIIPGLTFALGVTVECFDIPGDVLAICVGKSTYARSGLIVNVTPLEPKWRGQVTLELHNTHAWPMKVYADEGICQFLFMKNAKYPQQSYADRNGKYQDQRGIQLGKV